MRRSMSRDKDLSGKTTALFESTGDLEPGNGAQAVSENRKRQVEMRLELFKQRVDQGLHPMERLFAITHLPPR